MKTVQVDAPSHQYPIYIGQGLLQDFDLFKECFIQNKSMKAVIVTNETVAPLYLDNLLNLLNKNNIQCYAVILKDGEQYKNHESLNQIYDALLSHHADRRTTLIALGGGVIGDMAGFAAATYQRGIPFIQIPTTLLSQVDSSVGGKTAINHPLGKNMIGAFYQPQLVIADLDTLKTLPAREFSAGMAEVIKYGALGDANFLDYLQDNIDAIMQQNPELLTHIIAHCCQMKADIVAQDETEQGVRAHLNLGHTFGHAIEAQMGYGVWLHGEAVAAGMVLACDLSKHLGLINQSDTDKLIQLIQRANLPVVPPKLSFQDWVASMQHDKKVENGKMRFITLNQLGSAQITHIENTEILEKTLSPYLI